MIPPRIRGSDSSPSGQPMVGYAPWSDLDESSSDTGLNFGDGDAAAHFDFDAVPGFDLV